MDDIFRVDLAGYDEAYVEDVLDGFLQNAHRYGRKLLEIRVSESMFKRLEVENRVAGGFFKGVPVVIVSIPFEESIEVVVGRPQ